HLARTGVSLGNVRRTDRNHWLRLRFERAGVAATVSVKDFGKVIAEDAALVCAGAFRAAALINGRTVCEQRVRERWATIGGERAQLWIDRCGRRAHLIARRAEA